MSGAGCIPFTSPVSHLPSFPNQRRQVLAAFSESFVSREPVREIINLEDSSRDVNLPGYCFQPSVVAVRLHAKTRPPGCPVEAGVGVPVLVQELLAHMLAMA